MPNFSLPPTKVRMTGPRPRYDREINEPVDFYYVARRRGGLTWSEPIAWSAITSARVGWAAFYRYYRSQRSQWAVAVIGNQGQRVELL